MIWEIEGRIRKMNKIMMIIIIIIMGKWVIRESEGERMREERKGSLANNGSSDNDWLLVLYGKS